MHKTYMKDIDFARYKDKLSDIIDMLMCEIKENTPKLYDHIETELYESAYGKVVSKEMAINWVKSMKPIGMHWTMEETTDAMKSLGYSCDSIEFFVVANMMYNDYYSLVNEDEELALKLAYSWLKDEDSKDHKLYRYWKNVIKKE